MSVSGTIDVCGNPHPDPGIVADVTQPNPFAARALSTVSDPEDGVVTPEPEETPAEDVSDAPAVWTHETLTFAGDTLEVRKPTEQALAAYSLASSKYVSMDMRNDMTGLFIARHLSPDSYARVFSRLMDPDDEDYTINSIGELMRDIVGLRVPTTE